MKPNPRPVCGQPTRNVWCKDYSTCLDRAISLSWPTFSCRWCSFLNVRPQNWKEQAMADKNDCWTLVAAVFYPQYRWKTQTRPYAANRVVEESAQRLSRHVSETEQAA